MPCLCHANKIKMWNTKNEREKELIFLFNLHGCQSRFVSNDIVSIIYIQVHANRIEWKLTSIHHEFRSIESEITHTHTQKWTLSQLRHSVISQTCSYFIYSSIALHVLCSIYFFLSIFPIGDFQTKNKPIQKLCESSSKGNGNSTEKIAPINIARAHTS